MTDDYSQLLDRLAQAQARHQQERAAIEDWHAAAHAAAQDAVASRAAAHAAAQDAQDGAEVAVRFTDAEASRLWAVLASRLGRPVAALGDLPAPDDAEDTGEHPGRRLDRVRELLDEVRPVRRRVGRRIALVMLLFGLVVALAVAVALRRG